MKKLAIVGIPHSGAENAVHLGDTLNEIFYGESFKLGYEGVFSANYIEEFKPEKNLISYITPKQKESFLEGHPMAVGIRSILDQFIYKIAKVIWGDSDEKEEKLEDPEVQIFFEKITEYFILPNVDHVEIFYYDIAFTNFEYNFLSLKENLENSINVFEKDWTFDNFHLMVLSFLKFNQWRESIMAKNIIEMLKESDNVGVWIGNMHVATLAMHVDRLIKQESLEDVSFHLSQTSKSLMEGFLESFYLNKMRQLKNRTKKFWKQYTNLES